MRRSGVARLARAGIRRSGAHSRGIDTLTPSLVFGGARPAASFFAAQLLAGRGRPVARSSARPPPRSARTPCEGETGPAPRPAPDSSRAPPAPRTRGFPRRGRGGRPHGAEGRVNRPAEATLWACGSPRPAERPVRACVYILARACVCVCARACGKQTAGLCSAGSLGEAGTSLQGAKCRL